MVEMQNPEALLVGPIVRRGWPNCLPAKAKRFERLFLDRFFISFDPNNPATCCWAYHRARWACLRIPFGRGVCGHERRQNVKTQMG